MKETDAEEGTLLIAYTRFEVRRVKFRINNATEVTRRTLLLQHINSGPVRPNMKEFQKIGANELNVDMASECGQNGVGPCISKPIWTQGTDQVIAFNSH